MLKAQIFQRATFADDAILFSFAVFAIIFPIFADEVML